MVNRVSIAVFDDHPIYRAGVVQVLKREPGFQVIGEGNSADDAVRVVATLKPDVVILDVNMPGGGFEAARTIANNMPLTLIMMLTVLEDDSFATAALQAGVKSYATKGVSGPVLVRTIWTMVHGPDFISPSLAASLLCENSPAWPDFRLKTPRSSNWWPPAIPTRRSRDSCRLTSESCGTRSRTFFFR